MIDLLLVHPGAVHGIYGPLGDSLVAVEPPLWPRIIASYFLDRGRTVSIIDQEAERLSPDDVAERAAQLAPRLVVICVHGHQPSASTQQMTGAGAVAEALSNLEDEPMVVMCGNHPSALPERTLREEYVDFVVDGEGPVTIAALLGILDDGYAHERLPLVPGLVWQDEDGMVRENPRAPLLDMDRDLHGSSAWHLLPMHLYRAHNWQRLQDPARRQPYASIHTSLGCSYKCHFCMINISFHNNLYRRRSPQLVVEEIFHLYRTYGVRTFKIVDELFVLNRAHFQEICHRLIAADLDPSTSIWAYSRTDTVRPDDLPLLRAAGIDWLALGIEAGSPKVRAGANKALRGDDASVIGNAAITRIVRAIREAGINVIGNYIFGLRDDSAETMQETLDLALSLRTEFANFYCAHAYPGSPLYDQAVAEGWTLPASWSGYSQHNAECRPLDTETLPAAVVLRFRDAAFTTYFTDPGYLAMVQDKFGPAAVEEVRKMTEYKLERKLLTGEIT